MHGKKKSNVHMAREVAWPCLSVYRPSGVFASKQGAIRFMNVTKKEMNLILQENKHPGYDFELRNASRALTPMKLIDGRTACEKISQSPSLNTSMNLHHRSYPTLEDPDRRRMRRGARCAELFSLGRRATSPE